MNSFFCLKCGTENFNTSSSSSVGCSCREVETTFLKEEEEEIEKNEDRIEMLEKIFGFKTSK